MAMSESQALEAVKAVIAANGGKVRHSDLMAGLIANGAYEAQGFVRQFQQQRKIAGKLEAVSGSRPVLYVVDPSAAPVGGGE